VRSHSTSAGRQRRLDLCGLGLALLVALAAGCAHVPPPVPEAALAERILPPPGVGDQPPPAGDRAAADVPDTARPPESPPGGAELVAFAENHPSAEADRPEPVLDRDPAKPLTLGDAIALAFVYQPRLRLYQEGIEQARGQSQVAFAPFLPRAYLLTEAFASNNPHHPDDALPPPAPEFGDAKGFQDYILEELLVQWTLWDFGRTYGRYHQAELNVAIAQLQAVRASQTVAFDVASAYYRVLQARAARRVAEEAVRLAESVLEISRKSLKAGLVERDRVLRAEVQLALDRRSVVVANRAERVAVAAFNLAVGLNVSAPTEVADRTDEPAFTLSLADCLQRAVENRREFQVARRQIEVAGEGERVARADFAPRIFVQGMTSAEAGEKTVHGISQSGSIDIGWNLFQGGKRLGELRTAGATFRAAAAQAQIVCDNIAFEVNTAYHDLSAARQSIALDRPAITQARENLRLVTKKYASGDATPTDIVDAETVLTRAQQEYYNALYDYLTALARLEYAMGISPFLPAEGCK
jgi:outer membrane protein TolC